MKWNWGYFATGFTINDKFSTFNNSWHIYLAETYFVEYKYTVVYCQKVLKSLDLIWDFIDKLNQDYLIELKFSIFLIQENNLKNNLPYLVVILLCYLFNFSVYPPKPVMKLPQCIHILTSLRIAQEITKQYIKFTRLSFEAIVYFSSYPISNISGDYNRIIINNNKMLEIIIHDNHPFNFLFNIIFNDF